MQEAEENSLQLPPECGRGVLQDGVLHEVRVQEPPRPCNPARGSRLQGQQGKKETRHTARHTGQVRQVSGLESDPLTWAPAQAGALRFVDNYLQFYFAAGRLHLKELFI